MQRAGVEPFTTIDLEGQEFLLLRDWIRDKTGISLRESTKRRLSSRLVKRIQQLGLNSFRAYYDFLLTDDTSGAEERALVNCITINKTSFFREPHHFEFLDSIARLPRPSAEPMTVWSAACSSGEEPYSIAMTLLNVPGKRAGGQFRILASDIDTEVLFHAQCGIYTEQSLAGVPPHFRQRYFLRGSGEQRGFVRLKPAVLNAVTFRRINFAAAAWNVKSKFDVIFCRNALIYFERATQDFILRRLITFLKPRGYLIVGHSEHLFWMSDVLEPAGLTIYRSKNQLSASWAAVSPPKEPRAQSPRSDY